MKFLIPLLTIETNSTITIIQSNNNLESKYFNLRIIENWNPFWIQCQYSGEAVELGLDMLLTFTQQT